MTQKRVRIPVNGFDKRRKPQTDAAEEDCVVVKCTGARKRNKKRKTPYFPAKSAKVEIQEEEEEEDEPGVQPMVPAC